MVFTKASTGRGNAIRLEFTWKFPPRFIDFAKKSGQIINEDVVHDLIVDALGPAWQQARTNAPVDTGFLQDNIYVYMTTKVEGWLSADADYAAAQEYGFTDRHGTKHAGRNFMTPAWNTALKNLSTNMQFWQKAFVLGQQATFQKAGIGVKSGTPHPVSNPTKTGFNRTPTVTQRKRYPTDKKGQIKRKKVFFPSMRNTARFQKIGGKKK